MTGTSRPATLAKRFCMASVRGWSALDQTSRVLLVCAVGLILLAAVLPFLTLLGVGTTALVVFTWRLQRWREFDRRRRLLVVSGVIAAVVALVIGFGGLSRKSSLFTHQLVLHLPDETRLIRLKADPEAFVGKTFILCGTLRMADYYNYNYVGEQSNRYSFRFVERGKTWAEVTGEVTGYLERDRGKSIAKRVIEAEETFNAAAGCRIKATILPGRSVRWDTIEIINVQFLTSRGGWAPWMLGLADETR